MEDEWIYIGIFLNEISKKKLKKIFKLPIGWKEFFDHMTVAFNDESDYVKYVKSICDQLGEKTITLQVVGQGISDKAYAIKVEVPAGIPCANKLAHITLGCSQDGFPVDSNKIENWHSITNKNLTIKGTLKVFKPTSKLLNSFDIRNI